MLVLEAKHIACRGVLLDFDDTLIEAGDALCAIWSDLSPDYGVQLSPQEIDHLIRGRPAKFVVDEILPSLDPVRKQAFLRALEEREESYPYLLSPGGRDFLHAAQRGGLKLGLVTSSWPKKVHQVLHRYDLDHVFSMIVTRDDVQALKPDPAPYTLAIEKMGLAARDLVAVEDSPSGLQSACAAGLRCIGFGRSVPHDKGVIAMIADFTSMRVAPSEPVAKLGTMTTLLSLLMVLWLGFASEASAHSTTVSETFDNRDIILTVPDQLPPVGQRALVVALHGGMGNAEFMQSHLGMDAVAETYGFIVAYPNGTRAAPMLRDKRKAWNAGGGCCGVPFKNDVDDVGYLTAAVKFLIQKYGINPARVYGIGHSNGAMMTQRLMCSTNLYQAAVPVSGPLMIAGSAPCTAAAGKHILAIHGAEDQNVPIAGGEGTKGISGATFVSEAATEKAYASAGADYKLLVVPGVDHNLSRIDEALQKQEGISLAEKAARFFGLAPDSRLQ